MHIEWKGYSSHEVVSLDQLAEELANLVPPVQKFTKCSEHPSKELDLYCETCKEVICRDCTLEVHHDHQYHLVTEAFPQQKDILIASVEPVKKQLASVNKSLEGLDTQHGEITSQRQALEARIRASIGLIQGALKEREDELISQLDQMTEEKLKNIAARQDQLEQVGTRLKSCCGFLQESGSQVEVQDIAKSYVEKVQDVTSLSKPKSPVTEVKVTKEAANMGFVSNDNETTQICQKFGSVSISSICHAKCSAEGTELHVAVVGEAATVTVHVVDQKERAYQRPVEVSCELVSCSDGSSRVRGETKRVKDGQYDISYLPQHRGYHSLHIRLEDQHIPGSPFPLSVITTTPTNIITNVNGPWGITTNNEEQLVVVERYRNCISIINSQGKRIKSFRNCHCGCFLPCGVAVSHTGDILVCSQCQRGHHISVFSRDCKALRCFGTYGYDPLHFFGPNSIAVHPQSNKIYITESLNFRVQILNADLTFYKTFYGPKIINPLDISFDSAGNVYVVDSETCSDSYSVQVFTAEGEYIRQFGNKGSGEGELNEPKGIAIDSNDIVYISEWKNRISVFTCGGQFLRSFGSQGDKPGQFRDPTGIVVINGAIYVSDDNDRVQVF